LSKKWQRNFKSHSIFWKKTNPKNKKLDMVVLASCYIFTCILIFNKTEKKTYFGIAKIITVGLKILCQFSMDCRFDCRGFHKQGAKNKLKLIERKVNEIHKM
jgi:hypothetical protein